VRGIQVRLVARLEAEEQVAEHLLAVLGDRELEVLRVVERDTCASVGFSSGAGGGRRHRPRYHRTFVSRETLDIMYSTSGVKTSGGVSVCREVRRRRRRSNIGDRPG
jgi:hypothetical protein